MRYEHFILHILRLQNEVSRYFGEHWVANFPFYIIWLSRDHHGHSQDVTEGIPPFQTFLRRGKWNRVLRLMKERGGRDVICVPIESHRKLPSVMPGSKIEQQEIMNYEEKQRTQKTGEEDTDKASEERLKLSSFQVRALS